VTRHYNRQREREKRKALRRNSTPAEAELWTHRRAAQLGTKFRRQYSVDAYVLDFYAPRWKLAVEVDGASHFTEDGQEYDRARTALLQRFGIEVLRFSNREVLDRIDDVLERIERAARPRTSS
jgi:very-short-patch-repair endonuclease